MKTLYQFIIENRDWESMFNTVMGNDNFNNWLDKSYNNRDRRILADILNRVIDDKDIEHWMEDPHANEYKLRRILKKKLTEMEVRYMDEVVEKIKFMKQ